MKSYDFYAVAYDGEVYCKACCPVPLDSEEVFPVFADSEWDYYPSCNKCGLIHTYMNLTSDGREYEANRNIPAGLEA
jgi:hypothetical protein